MGTLTRAHSPLGAAQVMCSNPYDQMNSEHLEVVSPCRPCRHLHVRPPRPRPCSHVRNPSAAAGYRNRLDSHDALRLLLRHLPAHAPLRRADVLCRCAQGARARVGVSRGTHRPHMHHCRCDSRTHPLLTARDAVVSSNTNTCTSSFSKHVYCMCPRCSVDLVSVLVRSRTWCGGG